MSNFEAINSHISIARAVCPEDAAKLAKELDRLEEFEATRWMPDFHPDNVGRFWSHDGNLYPRSEFSPDVARLEPIPTLGKIAALPMLSTHTSYLINKQGPHSRQRLHPDSYQQPPVDVVQLSDDGQFFIGSEEFIEVGTGDIVRVNDNDYLHGGGNPSDHIRYTAVLFRFKE